MYTSSGIPSRTRSVREVKVRLRRRPTISRFVRAHCRVCGSWHCFAQRSSLTSSTTVCLVCKKIIAKAARKIEKAREIVWLGIILERRLEIECGLNQPGPHQNIVAFL